MENSILLKGIRTNNLKNIDLAVPLGKITALVGVSGAGKSSLAFHTLYAEGYIRYIESISPYIRQFLDQVEKPDIDRIENLPPAIAFRQKRPHKNPRSIVATASDIFDYLRILFAKIADFHCPDCGEPLRKFSIDEIVQELLAAPACRLRVCFPYQGDIAFLINRGFRFQVRGGAAPSLRGGAAVSRTGSPAAPPRRRRGWRGRRCAGKRSRRCRSRCTGRERRRPASLS
jgi:hypothetical protein